MPDIDCFQRIAVLETNQKELIRDIHLHEKREEIHMRQTNAMLAKIMIEQSKMRNFWAGIVFTITAFGSGAVIAFNLFFKD